MNHDLYCHLACDLVVDRFSLSGILKPCVTAFWVFVCHLVGLDAELSAVYDALAGFLIAG
jgi:hypothetical protein